MICGGDDGLTELMGCCAVAASEQPSDATTTGIHVRMRLPPGTLQDEMSSASTVLECQDRYRRNRRFAATN
jgi:hypothetical protein